MDYLSFTSIVIGSLAWPLVAIGAVWLLRKPVSELPSLVSKLRYKGFEAEFERALERVEEKLPTDHGLNDRWDPDGLSWRHFKTDPRSAILAASATWLSSVFSDSECSRLPRPCRRSAGTLRRKCKTSFRLMKGCRMWWPSVVAFLSATTPCAACVFLVINNMESKLRAQRDSNPRPLASEANTLSPELRAHRKSPRILPQGMRPLSGAWPRSRRTAIIPRPSKLPCPR